MILFAGVARLSGQGGRYWDHNLNSEAALLSGAVVAGEGGIAAIFYNPATISEMTVNNLSLSANLFSVTFFRAEDALGPGFPATRTQADVYPRIITLTLNPKRKPDLTIEMAYFTKTSDYFQINQGTSLTDDIIASNPGDENYAADYYLRSKFEDFYCGAGLGYRVNESLALGLSALISYKDDQYYNLISAAAFTGPSGEMGEQYLAESGFHVKYNMFDVRLITKAGIHYRQGLWAVGANITLPSVKLFGDGTVVKQYDYSNIRTDQAGQEVSSLFWGARQKKCKAHFRDPLSLAVGANYYAPSGRTILLLTGEYFVGMESYQYIEASDVPGEEGYDFTPSGADEWLTFNSAHKPVLNAGLAIKKKINDLLVVSGGFRTDFNYIDFPADKVFFEQNRKTTYPFDVYHFNAGCAFSFRKGSVTLGTQYSTGGARNQKMIVNLTEPVEFSDHSIMPLTGVRGNDVKISYNDISIYFGFVFNISGKADNISSNQF